MLGHTSLPTKTFILFIGWAVCIFLLGVWVGQFALPSSWIKTIHRSSQSLRSMHSSSVLSNRAQHNVARAVVKRIRRTQTPKRTRPLHVLKPKTGSVTLLKKSSSRSRKKKKSLVTFSKTHKRNMTFLRQSDLPAIALGRLRSARKLRRALKLLNQLRLPCGCGQSIAQCARSSARCLRVQRVVESVLDGVEQGQTRRHIVHRIQSSRKNKQGSKQEHSFKDHRRIRQILRMDSALHKQPSRGPKHALLNLVFFADFECPYSRMWMHALQQLELKFGSQNIRLFFRHFPMRSHPDAILAAEASMAAHEQGKFWSYHNMLFAHQLQLKRKHLLHYARELRLDMKSFKKALRTRKFRARILQEYTFATQTMQLSGTPHVLINGLPVRSIQMMHRIAQKAWKHAQRLTQQGVALKHVYPMLLQQR